MEKKIYEGPILETKSPGASIFVKLEYNYILYRYWQEFNIGEIKINTFYFMR